MRFAIEAPLKIAVPDVPYYVLKLRELLPHAVIEVPQDIEPLFDRSATDADAVALPAERGSAWTLRYPAYSVVVPGPDPIRVPLAYPIGRRDERLASFVNTWIALKGKDGTLDAACTSTGSSARMPYRGSHAGRSSATFYIG